MYFIGIMIFLLIGNVILFVGNGLGDLCRWRDAKNNWNPYTQEKSKYWYDHKGRRRLVSNGKEYTNEQQHWDVVREREKKKENEINEINRKSKEKAINEGKSVYKFTDGIYDDTKRKCKGQRYKDIKTGALYVKRDFTKYGYGDYKYIFYLNIDSGLYEREADETIQNPDEYKTRNWSISEKDFEWLVETRKDAINECIEHNKTITSNSCVSEDEFYDNYKRVQ